MTSIYAVIDTNVIVAALLSKHDDAATVQVVNAMMNGRIIPLYHQRIIEEYEEVLLRPKFHLNTVSVKAFINEIVKLGMEVFPQPTGEILVDMDDLVFFEVAMERRNDNAYLVTGNLKHYPIKDFIVTPAEMMRILSA